MRKSDASRIIGIASDEWGTPSAIVEAARITLGRIDLDPCSNERAQRLVRARRYWTREDDCLRQPFWLGRVWLNPPYSDPALRIVTRRFLREWRSGRIERAIALTNAVTSTEAGQLLLRASEAVLFPKSRIQFLQNGEPQDKGRYNSMFTFFGCAPGDEWRDVLPGVVMRVA